MLFYWPLKIVFNCTRFYHCFLSILDVIPVFSLFYIYSRIDDNAACADNISMVTILIIYNYAIFISLLLLFLPSSFHFISSKLLLFSVIYNCLILSLFLSFKLSFFASRFFLILYYCFLFFFLDPHSCIC